MRFHPVKYLLLWILAGTTARADAPSVSRSYRLLGVECGGCVYMVEHALRETKGITAVEVAQGVECRATVTYNPLLVGDHRIAQAVREATPIHGEPYTAQLKLRIRGYAEHSAAVHSVFERWKDSVSIAVLDADKGDLLLSFLPLKPGARSEGSTGWSLSLWAEAAKNSPPRGISWELPQE